MTKIGILAGNHEVGKYLCDRIISYRPENVAFVQHEGAWCVLEDIPSFKYTDESLTQHLVDTFKPDLIVLAWWPKILKHIHKTPGLTVINTHPSYLPYGRGKHPYYWSIVEGTPFGVTIHRVDDGVDTGNILWQKKVELTPLDTGESAYDKAVKAMKELIDTNLFLIANNHIPNGVPQDESKAVSHHSKDFELPPITKSEMRLYDGYDLINELRARTFDNDWSGRKIEIDGKIYRIHLNLVEE
jgi:methionyl-tRNA formyltransferase